MAGQGVRAAGYGFTAVLLGALLAARGFSSVQAGVVLTALIAGTALASLAVGRWGDRFGRRRSYAVFFAGIAVTLPGLAPYGHSGGVHSWLFLVLVPVGLTGAVLAARMSPAVEAAGGSGERSRLGQSRAVVRRLAGLFAVDAAGGGLVTTGFLSYYFAEQYHVSVVALGWLFFAVSVVQTVSVALAPLLARRFGLIATMVGTHLPSNMLLAAVAFAPAFPVAAVLLLARTTLSQMDVPTRQALVMTVVTPAERTAAAAVTNGSRYTVRPVGPLVAGLVQQVAFGAPLVVAGAVKAGYDLALWGWAKHAGLASRTRTGPPPAEAVSAAAQEPS